MLIACVAPGPSLPELPLELLPRCDAVIAVGLAFRYMWTRPTLLYSCDGRWWDRYYGEAAPHCDNLWTAHSGAAKRFKLNHVRVELAAGLSRDPKYIHGGGNSGYQAVNLARHLGATRILLVGYDMRPADDGRQHAFGEYEGSLRVKMPFHFFVEQFRTIPASAPELRIVNCTPRSAIDAFPFSTLEEELCGTV